MGAHASKSPKSPRNSSRSAVVSPVIDGLPDASSDDEDDDTCASSPNGPRPTDQDGDERMSSCQVTVPDVTKSAVAWSLWEGPALQRLNVIDGAPVHADFLDSLTPLPGVDKVDYGPHFYKKHGVPPDGPDDESVSLFRGCIRHHLKGGNNDSHHHELWRMLLIRRRSGGSWLWPVGRDTDLHDVASLDLGMTRVAEWPCGRDVVWLDISNMGLSHLPDALWELSRLCRLEAHCNTIAEVPAGIARLQSLDYLSLHTNAITTVSPELSRLSRLRWLSLNGNLLTQPPAVPPGVERLSLHCNKLNSIPPSGLAPAGPHIMAVSLFGNQLPAIPPAMFSSLTNCTTCALMRNALTSIPDTVGDMIALTDLWLFSNALTHLPDAIGRLANLKRFWCDKNRLRELPETMGQLSSLEELYAADNQLAALPPSLVHCTALVKLNVDNNQPHLVLSLPPSLRSRLVGEAAAHMPPPAAPVRVSVSSVIVGIAPSASSSSSRHGSLFRDVSFGSVPDGEVTITAPPLDGSAQCGSGSGGRGDGGAVATWAQMSLPNMVPQGKDHGPRKSQLNSGPLNLRLQVAE